MRKIILIVLCFCSLSIFAQDYKIGLFLGPNFSFLSVKSNYSYYWSDQYKPGFGFELGALGSLKLSEKLSFDHTFSFQFLTHKDKNKLYFKDADGYNYYAISQHTLSNGYIVISPQLGYHINEKLYLGSGVNLNIVLYSFSYFKDSENYFYKETSVLNNTYYKSVNLGIPLVIGYNHNKIFVRFRFDIGMSNLMKDSNSFFREKEHTLSLDFGYFFR